MPRPNVLLLMFPTPLGLGQPAGRGQRGGTLALKQPAGPRDAPASYLVQTQVWNSMDADTVQSAPAFTSGLFLPAPEL